MRAPRESPLIGDLVTWLPTQRKAADWSVIMPFYRILLVTRNDLAAASIYNKFVETAKYVINNGGVFQRIYNTGNQIFRYPLYSKANSKTYTEGPMFFLQFCSSPQVMERVCDSLKNSTYYLRIEKEKINTMSGVKL